MRLSDFDTFGGTKRRLSINPEQTPCFSTGCVEWVDYNLPEGLIAQYPLPQRDSSKLLILHKAGGKIEHRIFKDLNAFIKKEDILILNDTKVFKARLLGKREGFEGRVEVLLTNKKRGNIYAALCKPSRKLKEDTTILFGEGRLKAKVIGEEEGFKLLHFYTDGDLYKILEDIGKVPLPPYIRRDTEKNDEDRYQTVYAKETGAIAAPTAGLHFTDRLISEITSKGVNIAYLTLHVGYATFKPVKEEDIAKHKMHKEYFEIPQVTLRAIGAAKENNKKVIAVGTTTCRALESYALSGSAKGETGLFIYPGFKFKTTDALLTNFHLPRTTLLMLVCAFAGRDNIMRAYSEAIDKRYRFYSYGDAMLIL